jgi:acetyl-CoA synthetase
MPKTIPTRDLNGVPPEIIKSIADGANEILSRYEGGNLAEAAPDAWDEIRKTIINPEMPIEVKRTLYDAAFDGWDQDAHGPRPTWRADEDTLAKSNIQAMMTDKGFKSYDELYDFSIKESKQYWTDVVERLDVPFKHNPDQLVDNSNPKEPKWFPGAEMNIADFLFQANEDKIALIYKKQGGEIEEVSYKELDERSNQVANALQNQGLKSGDYVAIDMPMNVEAVTAYIGMLKAGCTVTCLADSFEVPDIDIRLKQIPEGVKAVFTQDATAAGKGFPLYDKIVASTDTPMAIVVSSTDTPAELKRDGDITWEQFNAGASKKFESVPLDPSHNVAVIFSSSTSTGKEKEGEEPKSPKAIPWKADAAIKSASDAHMHHDMQEDKVLNWQTNFGWMMGSFNVFAALGNKGTLALYEGNLAKNDYGKFIEEAKVNVLGVVPAVSEAWERTDCMKGCDWSNVEVITSTGAPSNPSNYFHLMSLVPGFAPVFEYQGGTEVGGGGLTGSVFHPASPSMFTTPTLGTELAFPANDFGSIDFKKDEFAFVIPVDDKRVAPMGLSTKLLNYDHESKYFAKNGKTPDGSFLREHGDIIVMHPNGFLQSNGRADGAININSIRTSSEELEGFIGRTKIAGVKDAAVVSVRPPNGGEDLVLVVAVLDDNARHIDESMLRTPFKKAIKQGNAQLARVDAVTIVKALETAPGNSSKIKRNAMRDEWVEEQEALHDAGKGTVLYGDSLKR